VPVPSDDTVVTPPSFPVDRRDYSAASYTSTSPRPLKSDRVGLPPAGLLLPVKPERLRVTLGQRALPRSHPVDSGTGAPISPSALAVSPP
jgi:hypothetical protein